jgi:hypothetical protein
MNKEFVKYEQALALKELGFDEPCMSSRDMNNGKGLIQLPLYQQAFRWFREKHNLQAEMVFSEKPDRFYYYIGNMVTGDMDRGINMSYEEAESSCLYKLIEITKNK